MTAQVIALPQLLRRLAEAVSPRDQAQVEELQRRLAHQVLRVVVVGEAKRGKSTLVNALLGGPVLPTGAVPLTALTTTVRHGLAERVQVAYFDGRAATFDLEALDALVTETGNPENRRGVASVTVEVPSPLLRGVELVDTPGIGSVHRHNSVAAQEALGQMDAAIVVLGADPPITAAEQDFLREVAALAVQVFVVVNKADRVLAEELREVLAFTAQSVTTVLGRPTAVWPMSARAALAGKRLAEAPPLAGEGYLAFERALVDYLRRHRSGDVLRSVTAATLRLAVVAEEEAAVEAATLALAEEDLEARLSLFTGHLRGLELARRDTAAIIHVALAAMLQTTNESAAVMTAGALRGALAAAHAALAGGGTGGEAEQHALDAAQAEIRRAVDAWRTDHGEELEQAVVALTVRAGDQLTGHINAVRAAAAELFSVELPPQHPPGGLSTRSRFRYAFEPDLGTVEALTAAVRTRLPARWRDRRVRRHLAERVPVLLDKQVGRARSDFQDRLADTERALLGDLDTRFADGAGRIAEAVNRGQQLRLEHANSAGESAARLGRQRAELRALTQALRSVGALPNQGAPR